MSTIKATNISHASSSTPNIVTDTNGNITLGGSITFPDATTQATASARTGQVIFAPSTSTPTGYLRCDGSVYSQSAYPNLYAAIGAGIAPQVENINATGLTGTPGVDYTTDQIVELGSKLWRSSGSVLQSSSDNGVTWTTPTGASGIRMAKGPNSSLASNGSSTYVMTYAIDAGCALYELGVMYSTNSGSTFTRTSRVSLSNAYSNSFRIYVAFGGTGNRFVLMSVSASGGAPTVTLQLQYSTNGSTWTNCTKTAMQNSGNGYSTGTMSYAAMSLAASPGEFLIITPTSGTSSVVNSGNGQLGRSTDGITFSPITEFGFTCNDVIWTGSFFILTTSEGVYQSTTGAASTWTPYEGFVPTAVSGGYYLRPADSQLSLNLDTYVTLPAKASAALGNYLYYNSGSYQVKAMNLYPYNTGTSFVVPDFEPTVQYNAAGGVYASYIKT